jgi:two-component system catabolic regulation response regulator CreB
MILSGTILVIEDEPGIADTITYALSTEGFQPVWCSTGKEGMEALAGREIDLIVLDIGLPDTDGFELCKEIRKSSDIPIIFLTARSEEIDRVVGLEIGGDDYVVKPFSPRELAARVKAILRRSAGKKSEERAGEPAGQPLRVDEASSRIFYYDEQLELSRHEFRILKALAEHPGWIFSREKLMALAWDEPEASLERTVDAHIKNLRAKLRAIEPEVDPIKTHRGMGYSLREDW